MERSPAALIVGGLDGVAPVLAQRLMGQGWDVALSGDDEEEGDELLSAFPGLENAEFIPAHPDDEGDVSALMEEAEALFDRLDLLLFAFFPPFPDPLGKTPGQLFDLVAGDHLQAPYLAARYGKRLLEEGGKLAFLHPPFPEEEPLGAMARGGLESWVAALEKSWAPAIPVARFENRAVDRESALALLEAVMDFAAKE